LLLPAGLAAALVAVGCGSPSASQAYAKKLESICAPYVSTAQPSSGDPLAQVRQVVQSLDRLLPQLRAVPGTPDTRARSQQLLAEMKQLLTIQTTVFDDLRAGKQQSFATLETRYERVAARLHTTAAALGAPSCSRAANPRD
jgi:hypothetical protein